MCQKKPFSSSLGIFTNLYTTLTDFSLSRRKQQQLEEAELPSLPPQQGQGKQRSRLGTRQKPQSQAHRRGTASTLLTALPTPGTLQVSLLNLTQVKSTKISGTHYRHRTQWIC